MSAFGFQISAVAGLARRGTLTTAHGTVETPAFMPVGTNATVKAMTPDALRETGAEMILANAYHLMLRPSAERVADLGGLHRFMNWPGPILTDSGGFQVMSLAKLRSIDNDGVTFRSHIDGSEHRLTPERAVQIQHLLDADVTMVFDECTPYPASAEQTATSMRLSMRWAERSKSAFTARRGYALFGIVQGGLYPELRAESATTLRKIGFDGYAVGGLAVGEGRETMLRVLDGTVPELPMDKPRYLMGVGRPDDILGAVKRGIDLFDCVLPTRSGRTAQAFTRTAMLNLRNAKHATETTPLDPDCRCTACRGFSRAYIHHLCKADEILAAILLTTHNLTFYQDFVRTLREGIAAGDFDSAIAGFPIAQETPSQGEATVPDSEDVMEKI